MQVIRKVSSAHLIALLALFVALGGSAYAIHLGKNAVKTKNIKNGAVVESKLANGAVVESKLANGAVSSPKLAGGAVGAGNLGFVAVRTATKPLPDGGSALAIASCLSGERLIGGSAIVSTGNSSDIVVNGDSPTQADGSVDRSKSPTSWTVQANNYPGGDTNTATAIANALCLK
jgi:hypothetical protein